MTILVDEARWPWRGTHWCHLVSDRDLPELHAFAERLGCRRIGFQGDHYDIDVEMRLEAIELGAVAVDSRQLVRRLRAAGLRLRPSAFEKWSLVDRWEPVTDAGAVTSHPALPDTLVHPARRTLLDERVEGAFLLARTHDTALVIHGTGPGPTIDEDGSAGIHVRRDRLGRWAVELVEPPLTPDR